MKDNRNPALAFIGEGNRQSFVFGPFEFFADRQLLLKGGSPVRVGGRALDLLAALVRNAGEVVTKRALMSHVWPSMVVEDGNLKVNMSALRRALSDGNDPVEYIETVTGLGYRFVETVRLGGDYPPLNASTKAGQPGRNNLAVATTRILGRADTIESISLDLSKSRLVSIVGPGGVGKTTVAIAIAEGFLDKFPDGVWFVDLATIKDEKLLPSAVAIAAGGGGQLPNSVDALCEQLAGRKLLLLLDSCEHIIDAVAACANRILASASGVKLLVTSREALMLSGERVRRLPSLAIPPISDRLDAGEALRFSAIQLFVERATESCETFRLSDQEAPAAADICRKLDGLALAIELAATRVDAFGVKGLQRQLRDRLLPLTVRRSGPERHRTLAATIEWSYGLLTEKEAQVLRAVSAFAGSFNVEGAATVAGVPASDAKEFLAQLAAKSLLSIDIDGDEIAYRLLETTRAFCLERLRQGISHNPILQRHARYICELLHRATGEWAQQPNRELAANYDRVLTDLYAAVCTSTMVSQALMFQAMDAMRRAVEIANDIGDVESQQRSLRMLGVYELFVGDPRSSLRTFEKFAAVVATHAPDLSTESETFLGTAELFLGQLEASRNRLEPLWERNLLRAAGSPQTSRIQKDIIATFDVVLPHPRWLTGSPDGAIELARAAVAHASEQIVKNNALAYAVPVIYWCGLYDECRFYAAMLETHSDKHGFHPRRPIASLYLAALDCVEGDSSDEKVLAMQAAIEELRIANHLARMPYHLCLLAEGLIGRKRYEEAETVINAALDSIRDQGEAWCLPEVLRFRARVLSGRQDDDGAEGALLVAIQKAKDIGALSWELRAANDLATLWAQHARAQEAREMLEPILGRFSEGYATRDLLNAAELLRELSGH
ncbi:MAG TPA: winged helix-turn-helix domain-containing protein [Steroidobacter sp.]